MTRWILIGVAAVVALAAATYGAGALLPPTHVAVMEGVVAKTPAEIAAIVRNVRAYPTWRRGVVVEDIVLGPDTITYVEIADEDRIAYRLTEPLKDRQFVAAITNDDLPFGGQWTITLAPEGVGARVRIREDGEVRDPVYRFFLYFVFGATSSMEAYLSALGARDIAPPPITAPSANP